MYLFLYEISAVEVCIVVQMTCDHPMTVPRTFIPLPSQFRIFSFVSLSQGHVLSCYVILIFEVPMKLQAQGGCHFSGRGTGFYGFSSVAGLSPGKSDGALGTCGFRLRI